MLPSSKYDKNESKYDGLASPCKDCVSIRQAAKRKSMSRAEKNKENVRLAKYKRGWRKKYPKKARHNRRLEMAKWRKANPDKIKENNKIYGPRWRKANPDKAREACHRRRARMAGVSGEFTAIDWLNQYYMQDGKCWYCEEKRKLTVDHVLPLGHKKCTHSPQNIVLACGPCNDSKNDKTIFEWKKTSYYEENCL